MICIVAVSNKNGISVIIPVVPGKINLPQKIRLDIYFTKIIKCWLNAEFMIFDSFEKRGRNTLKLSIHLLTVELLFVRLL